MRIRKFFFVMTVFLVFCMLLNEQCWAQDERFFRKIFSGEFMQEKKIVDEKKYSYVFHTPEFYLDLNNDGEKESFVFVKKDSEDWIDIFNSIKQKIFSYRFEVKGVKSGLYRVLKKQLYKNLSVFVLFYFEGESDYLNYESSSRIYFLTVDQNDLKKISIYKGPSIFEEAKTMKGHYHLKNYDVQVLDLNASGEKSLVIRFNGISQVFIYEGEGVWKTYRR